MSACADEDPAAPSPQTTDDVGTEDAPLGTSESPAPSGPKPGSAGYLLVAELAEEAPSIAMYSLPDLTRTGVIEGVRLSNHAGAIALADGRVITADDAHGEIIAIGQDAMGAPAIVARAAADLGEGAVWGCGDAALRHLAIASGHEGKTTQVANVLTLADFSLHKLDVPMNVLDGETEELHLAVGGDPLHLLAGVGAEIRAYPLAPLLAGQVPAAVASIPIAPGSHGPLIAHEQGVFYVATRPGAGFDGVALTPPFARARTIPWDADGRTTGRNGRPRLSWDGRAIYGAITQASPEAPERWAERAVDLHVADLATSTAHRAAITTGIVSRFQLSRPYALFANVTGAGDYAVLVDVAPGSPTRHQVVARIPLDPLSDGPVVGAPTTDKEARASAITPDGRLAFVSHGGDGKISVIDTQSKKVTGTIETPTHLHGGGYLLAVQPGVAPVDTCLR